MSLFSSVRYKALAQEESESVDIEMNDIRPDGFGAPEGTFESAFTYANYNDLDNMGYEAPKRFGKVLGAKYGKFTFNRAFEGEEVVTHPMNPIELIIYGISLLAVICTLPFSLLFSIKFVSNTEKLVVMRLGRAQKSRGPGATFVLPCIDSVHKISTSITAFNVPPIQVITADRGLVELGATVFLQVRDPISAVCAVQDRNNSTRTLANTMLYRYITKKRVCEISNGQDRRILAANFKDELGAFTAQYGVEITDVEVSDVKVLKEGENMGLAALSSVAKSDAGQQIWKAISPLVEEFTKEMVAEKKHKAPEFSSQNDFGDFNFSPEPIDPHPNDIKPAIDVNHLVTVSNMAIDEHLTRAVGRIFQINCDGLDPITIDLRHPPGSAYIGTSSNPDVIFDTSQITFFGIMKKTIR
ncbi:hypothetical protein WR25_22514 isoform A [Diploscapter pachys]|uniref:Band 7 domain-containing protein n=1 Tax=Diploscapter pachys TaxID=2018661 RepID=A0A2A2JY48_9BILA|nr:hypothetical protein WR25_22514 isoform A [Diploscapter pachys]